MKKTTIYILLALVFGLTTVANAKSDWTGEYEFFEDCGKTAGGSSISVSTKIKITEKQGKLRGFISASGYMTWYEIFADVKTKGGDLELYFLKTGKGRQIQDFNKGDLLLVIQRSRANGKPKVALSWKKSAPAIAETEGPCKISFEKLVPPKSASDISKEEASRM